MENTSNEHIPIPKDIFEKHLLYRITPCKIKGEFKRSQESWKLLVESKYNGGQVIEKDIDHYDRD